jgi:hypothetical protein
MRMASDHRVYIRIPARQRDRVTRTLQRGADINDIPDPLFLSPAYNIIAVGRVIVVIYMSVRIY